MTQLYDPDFDVFFTQPLRKSDDRLYALINGELHRQSNHIEMIASENIVSAAVLEAQGSILTNKYAEGYPGKRYYGGCTWVDEIEKLAISRACELFQCHFANVQPHSGSQANMAAYMALIQPGDKIMGMNLNAGGHLTHGSTPSFSSKYYEAINYGVDDEGLLDYDEIEALALKEKPQLIICGASAYTRNIDFAKFRTIADKVNAYLIADIAHIAGLVCTGEHPNPFPHAHIVTSTTHKTLRGARGGLILTNDSDLAKKINSAIFPGLQGGPLLQAIAGKAAAFKEALAPSFKDYIKQVKSNAQTLADTLQEKGLRLVTGGTDNHMVLVNLTPLDITGKAAEDELGEFGIVCNKNTIPQDPRSPFTTSGIRLGTAAITSRGFKEKDLQVLSVTIADILLKLADEKNSNQGSFSYKEKKDILENLETLCRRHPVSYTL